MAKIANAAEDVDVTMTPRRSHVTKTKRPQTQPTPPQMILNFEETSAVADVDVAAETLHENLLQMVKIANAAEDVDVMMTPRRSHVTKTKRPQTRPTPPQMTLNFEETS